MLAPPPDIEAGSRSEAPREPTAPEAPRKASSAREPRSKAKNEPKPYNWRLCSL